MSQSATDSPRNVTKYLGQDYRFTPTYLRNRDPIAPQLFSPDIKPKEQQGYYPVNSLWTNTTNQNVWLLTGILNNLARWVLISTPGGGGNGIQFIQAPTGDPVVPDMSGGVDFISDGTVNITPDGMGNNQVSFSALPVLSFLKFNLPGIMSPVSPTAGGDIYFSSGDNSIVFSAPGGNTIDFTTSAATGVKYLTDQDGVSTLPDGLGGIQLSSQNNTVITTSPVNPLDNTMDLNALPVLTKLKITTDSIPPVSISPDVTGELLFINGGNISFDGSGGNTLSIASSADGLMNGLKDEVGVKCFLDGEGFTTLASVDETVTTNSNTPGNSFMDLSSLPVLSKLKIHIPSGANISPVAQTINFLEGSNITFSGAGNNLTISSAQQGTMVGFLDTNLEETLPDSLGFVQISSQNGTVITDSDSPGLNQFDLNALPTLTKLQIQSNGGGVYSTPTSIGNTNARLNFTSSDNTITITPSGNAVNFQTTFPATNRILQQIFTEDDVYIPTDGMQYCKIECVGAGGGGGSGSSLSTGPPGIWAGGGGGGGEYANGIYSSTDIGTFRAVTIGVGGAGGPTGQLSGQNGTDSFVENLITSKGGEGGDGTTGFGFTAGGIGGTGGTGGQLRIAGNFGGFGLTTTTNGTGIGGAGAISPFSPGCDIVALVQTGDPGALDGNPGLGYGGGGGGGVSGRSSSLPFPASGGRGCDGIVVITEYI